MKQFTIRQKQLGQLVLGAAVCYQLVACGNGNLSAGGLTDLAAQNNTSAASNTNGAASNGNSQNGSAQTSNPVNDLLLDVTSPASSLQASLGAAVDAASGASAVIAPTAAQTAPDVPAGPVAPNANQRNGSCVRQETSPSPLDYVHLPLLYSIRWVYTACEIGDNSTLQGSRALVVNRDPNIPSRNEINEAHLVRQYNPNTFLDSNSVSQLTTVGSIASGNVEIEAISLGEREFTQNSAVVLHQKFSLQLTIFEDYSASKGASEHVTQFISGRAQIQHLEMGATSTILFQKLTREPTICPWPVSGDIEVKTTHKDNSTDDSVYRWSLPCGTVSAQRTDGQQVNSTPPSVPVVTTLQNVP